ncbi:MAG: PilT/PilU family type 4a pilus ATPase [Planctomycetes bacterium]|nr:PilT/PilU family type 4a pilus ATPase [Planctomycetota bacterium]
MLDLAALFDQVTKSNASDLHLRVGLKPRLRVHGERIEAQDSPAATDGDLEELLVQSLHDHHRVQFEAQGEVDVACQGPLGTRYRTNYFRDARGIAASFRRIQDRVQSIAELGMPAQVEELAKVRRGLVLITGATGSGKSSTLAALVDWINRNETRHIVTLEDPVEFVHKPIKSLIRQRNLGEDVLDFASGVRDALRGDVDVLLVGELRDVETTRAALSASETGMLVFGTLHTNDAAQTIDRLIDVFPAAEQDQVRTVVAEALAAVLSQTLLTRASHRGRVAATELMVATPAIQALIREGRTHDIPNFMQGGRDKGMWRMNDSITRLMKDGTISQGEQRASMRGTPVLDTRKPQPSAT